MELIKIYNDHTGKVLKKTSATANEADDFEIILDFVEARYECFSNGEQLY